MLSPHKYMDINNSVLVVGSKILTILLLTPRIKYSLLFSKLKSDNNDIEVVLPEALSFLYLLGKIDYIQSTDEVEIIP